MNSTLGKVLLGALPATAVLVALATFLPLEIPLLVRQLIMFAWSVGAILVAEKFLSGRDWLSALRSIGFVPPSIRVVIVALAVSLPMWLAMPVLARLFDYRIGLNPHWLAALIGAILVNGIAEEVIHRGFVFRHMRDEHKFMVAAGISAIIFGAQHLYLFGLLGKVGGLASIGLAVILSFPLAFLFEKGGNSLAGPMILHTSANAPGMIFIFPPEVAGSVILPFMAVVLVSLYLSFLFAPYLEQR